MISRPRMSDAEFCDDAGQSACFLAKTFLTAEVQKKSATENTSKSEQLNVILVRLKNHSSSRGNWRSFMQDRMS